MNKLIIAGFASMLVAALAWALVTFLTESSGIIWGFSMPREAAPGCAAVAFFASMLIAAGLPAK